MFSDACRWACCQVNEPDHAVVPVEVRNVDEVVEDKAPINYGVNGDVKGITLSSGLEGADLDPADQTLVEGLSQDADTSVIQGTVVSDIPHFVRLCLCFGFNALLRFSSVFPSASACFRAIVLIPIFHLFPL